MEQSRWYIFDGRESAGPYTPAEVLTFPGLTPETQVCREGGETWRALREVPELCPPPAVPAPAPTATPPPVLPPPGNYPFAGMVAHVLTVPRPLLLLALIALVWGGSMLFNAAWRAKIDPRLEDAQSLILRGRGAEAEALCRAVVAEQPGRAQAHYLLGEALLVQHKNKEALAAFQQAQKLNPTDPRLEQKIIILRGMGGQP